MKNDIEIGIRLRKLRKNARLIQEDLFDELNNIIEDDAEFSDSEYPKQTISKLENGVIGLSLQKAMAYAKFFHVSLDYLYFGTENYKPEYKDIKKMLGFSNDALHQLEELNKKDKTFIFVLNNFLEPNLSSYFINLLQSYFNYYNLGVKGKAIKNEFIKYSRSKGFVIENADNYSWEFYPKETEYTSLYKISIESNELANKFKKNGGK